MPGDLKFNLCSQVKWFIRVWDKEMFLFLVTYNYIFLLVLHTFLICVIWYSGQLWNKAKLCNWCLSLRCGTSMVTVTIHCIVGMMGSQQMWDKCCHSNTVLLLWDGQSKRCCWTYSPIYMYQESLWWTISLWKNNTIFIKLCVFVPETVLPWLSQMSWAQMAYLSMASVIWLR